VSTSQSESDATVETTATADPLQEYADSVAEAVGGNATVAFETIKVEVDPSDWVETHRTARDDLDLVFFSWLSAVDWSNEVEAGDPLSDEVEERFEILTTVADLTEGRRVTFHTYLDKADAAIDSLVEVYAGANWHEREAAEMFGLDFRGHPGLSHLYLPDAFVGNPLRKSFPLLSREVKPWPGTVDVEGMPDSASEENPEA
jgi:NADH:ubiquinone oxidoreductase subunit C